MAAPGQFSGMPMARTVATQPPVFGSSVYRFEQIGSGSARDAAPQLSRTKEAAQPNSSEHAQSVRMLSQRPQHMRNNILDTSADRGTTSQLPYVSCLFVQIKVYLCPAMCMYHHASCHLNITRACRDRHHHQRPAAASRAPAEWLSQHASRSHTLSCWMPQFAAPTRRGCKNFTSSTCAATTLAQVLGRMRYFLRTYCKMQFSFGLSICRMLCCHARLCDDKMWPNCDRMHIHNHLNETSCGAKLLLVPSTTQRNSSFRRCCRFCSLRSVASMTSGGRTCRSSMARCSCRRASPAPA